MAINMLIYGYDVSQIAVFCSITGVFLVNLALYNTEKKKNKA